MNIRWNLSGMEIERESFRVIESECDLHKRMPAPEWRVARRLIHTIGGYVHRGQAGFPA